MIKPTAPLPPAAGEPPPRIVEGSYEVTNATATPLRRGARVRDYVDHWQRYDRFLPCTALTVMGGVLGLAAPYSGVMMAVPLAGWLAVTLAVIVAVRAWLGERRGDGGL